MIQNEYLRQIEEYSKSELKRYSDILSVKYYKQIEAACHDIQNFGFDYISLGFFTPVQPPIYFSNMPNWSIPYNKEGWWKLDTINKPNTFYLLGTDHILQSSFKKNQIQEQLYKYCESFKIFELFSILKSLGKIDLNIIAHTHYPVIDINRFFYTSKQLVINFSCLFISRLKPILIKECPLLVNEPILWDKNLLNDVLSSKIVYSPLTLKESEVLYQTSQGLSATSVAKEIGVSVKSVNRSLERARKKLDCTNTFQAVSKANFLDIWHNKPIMESSDNILKLKKILSDRELETVFWTSFGYSAKEIARQMKIEYKTVEKYLSNAECKLNCKNKAQLIYKAHSYGLLNDFLLKSMTF